MRAYRTALDAVYIGAYLVAVFAVESIGLLRRRCQRGRQKAAR